MAKQARPKRGDVAVGRMGGGGPKHAVLCDGDLSMEPYWWPLCTACATSGGGGVLVTELCNGPVTCRACQRTFAQLKQIMEE